MIFALENGRTIPKRDKIFELNARAKEMIKKNGRDRVINGTIGALLDDEGELAVITSVIHEMNKLRDKDFAEYAPIGGIPKFKDAIVKAVHGNNPVELFTSPNLFSLYIPAEK